MSLPRSIPAVFAVLFAVGLSCPATAIADNKKPKEQPKPGEWIEMFNGKDLTGWDAAGGTKYKDGGEEKPVWTVRDGMICCAGKGYGFLTYDKELRDFVIHVEYRMSKGCNSGLGIRGKKYNGKRNTRASTSGYEMQIIDDAGRKPGNHSSGSLYRYVAPKENATLPAGEWNVVEIECRGPKIRITMNGKLIHDVDQSQNDKIKKKPLQGYFSMQNHGRKIEFRNLRLKEL